MGPSGPSERHLVLQFKHLSCTCTTSSTWFGLSVSRIYLLGESGRQRSAAPRLRTRPGAVCRAADRVIPASEHQQVKQLLITEQPGQPMPQVIADVGGVVQGIGRLDEQPVRSSVQHRSTRSHARGMICPAREAPAQRRTPRALPTRIAPAAGAGPVDNDLAATQQQREPLAELEPPQPLMAVAIGRFRTTYGTARSADARRHHGVEPLGGVRSIWRTTDRPGPSLRPSYAVSHSRHFRQGIVLISKRKEAAVSARLPRPGGPARIGNRAGG